jgi:hypothetical protein
VTSCPRGDLAPCQTPQKAAGNSISNIPRERQFGVGESSTPRSPSAAPAAASDLEYSLSPASKHQHTLPRHPEPAGPRQVECPKGYSI